MSSCVRHDWDDDDLYDADWKEISPKIEKEQHKCCTKALMLKMIELIDLSFKNCANDHDCETYNKLRNELISALK